MSRGKKIASRAGIFWDERLSWASAVFFIGSVANASLKSVLPIPDSLWGIISLMVGAGIICFYFAVSKEMLRRSARIFWRSLSLFLCLYMLSAILIISRGESLNTMLTGSALLTFAWWIPSGVLACSVYDKEVLYNVWVKASYIISVFSIIIYFFHIPNDNSSGGAEYNMTFGFYIILPLLIQINEYQRNKKFWILLLIFFETFTIVVYANRGILLSLIFFIVYKFAFESNSRSRKIFSIIILFFWGWLMLSSLQTIATITQSVFDVFGFESRIVQMLAEGNISDTTGRNEIWKYCMKMIEERPLFGWGLGGEFSRLTQDILSSKSVAASASCSPHNGVIQNFVNFGVIGGIISTMIILVPMLYLRKVKDPFAKILIVIFGASRMIPDLVSGDGFFTEPKVAIYLYLFYFWKHGYRQQKKNEIGLTS